jgi:HK97 family phage major capsid protein
VNEIMVDLSKALREGSDPAGGYTVPEEFANKIYELMQAKSKMLPLMEQVNMNSDTWKAPTVGSGTTSYWVAELGTITASEMTFSQVTLIAKKIAAKVQLSTELDEDSIIDVMNLVSGQMATDLANSIDTEILVGAGGQFTTNCWENIAGNVIHASSGGDDISIAKFNNAIYEGQVDFMSYDYAVMHPRSIKNLRALTDSTGRPMFNEETFGSPLLKDGIVGTIYGLKVLPHTGIPITLVNGGSGAVLTEIFVAESKKCGIYGRRRGMTAHKFYDIDNDSWTLQVNMRCAFAVAYPNAICKIKDLK